MSIRGTLFAGCIGAIWALTVENANYFGLAQPWGLIVIAVGGLVIGILSPNYRRSGA